MSLCAPPTPYSTTSGFSPNSAAARAGLSPRSRAAFQISATVARLAIAAIALYVSALAAIDSGASR